MENSTITKDVEIASKTSRLLAFLIDNLIIQTIFFSYIYFIEDITLWNYLDKEFDLFDTLTGTLIALIYGSLIYPIFSGNIGHRIMGLKVVNIENKSNFNTFYVDCAENLKNCYFDNLKVLLDILMELKNNAFINNDILNQIGNKTKDIIDTMYHLSQYYYIFGIVSLLNANINKVDEQEMVLQQSFSKMLKKKSKTTAISG
jgi:hypothetical protein